MEAGGPPLLSLVGNRRGKIGNTILRHRLLRLSLDARPISLGESTGSPKTQPTLTTANGRLDRWPWASPLDGRRHGHRKSIGGRAA
jgi:hypothetical protein